VTSRRVERPDAGGPVVVALRDVDRTQVAVVGGKGALLGELSQLDDVRVPPGFCVTTHAFERFIDEAPTIGEHMTDVEGLRSDDPEAIRATSAGMRRALERLIIPDDVAGPIGDAVAALDHGAAFAVRSSATTEDSPAASFAGQHDTFLNVPGSAVLDHVKRCWASLFTERAVTYRLHHGIDHRSGHMAVVVQRMVTADAAGTMFTADPVTSNRHIVSVEAVFGLGDAVVSGLVNADAFKVRAGEIVERSIATKRLAVAASPRGGTEQHPIEPDRQTLPALTDDQVVRLAELGRRIEGHVGRPQDIEWCLSSDAFAIVQSRPMTTLFPVPDAGDTDNHVYISVGHQQMMTDAMKPLGLSFWLLTSPAPMRVAGGRLFVDVTRALSSPVARAGLLAMVGRSDPLIRDALETVVGRGDFLPPSTDHTPSGPRSADSTAPTGPDPAVVTELIAETEASLATLRHEIDATSGPELFELILADIGELKQRLFEPRSHQAVLAAITATWWLNDHLEEWLDERGAADVLAQSAPNNVTAEMGRALLDVADAIRPHPAVVALLERVDDDEFVDELPGVAGGEHARATITGFLDTYGMRCVGEIDITRPRWAERPAALVPLILGNVRNFEAGAATRRFEQGRREAATRERQLLERLRALRDGARKASATKSMIDQLRAFIGYREYPKYGMVSRYFIYKQAVLGEADRLAAAGVIDEPEDISYLTFHELHDAVRDQYVDRAVIDQRKREHKLHETLTPPRVITSDGETIAGAYHRDDVPPGALVGLPVSTGVVEGRARIVHDIAEADLEPGDILVTTHTDPSWSPVFITIAGLVTEVGGLTTHGAVVAREYGLPAVVGVEHATRLITDGHHIRLDGTNGYVQTLGAGDEFDSTPAS
jgi:phosphoenolpyruvate synthase/pyruvate phosphate dikinase